MDERIAIMSSIYAPFGVGAGSATGSDISGIYPSRTGKRTRGTSGPNGQRQRQRSLRSGSHLVDFFYCCCCCCQLALPFNSSYAPPTACCLVRVLMNSSLWQVKAAAEKSKLKKSPEQGWRELRAGVAAAGKREGGSGGGRGVCGKVLNLLFSKSASVVKSFISTVARRKWS